MSTVFEIGGRPIISLNGDWDNTNNNINNNNFSATSTVVLDPEASGGDWKKQIQGKHNIPVNQQRLTFPGSNFFSWNCASEDQSANGPVVGNLVTCLQSWQAVLRSEKRNIARLLYPEVLTDSDNLPFDLKSKAAEEIRDLGIPCSVYYLSFHKCILASQSQTHQGKTQDSKEVSNLCIEVNEDFQLKEFEVDLYGRLSKGAYPLHFQYHLNGRHLVAHLSMIEQTDNYRQGQKTRHNIEKGEDSVDALFDGNTTRNLINKDRAFALLKPTTNFHLPGSKEGKVIAVVSPTCQLRKIMLELISVDSQKQTLIKPERHLTPPVSRIDKNDKRAIGKTPSRNSKSLSKTRKINHLSEAKTPECTKEKSMISGISKDSKSEKESCNIHTDRVSACNLSENPADTLKFDETIKKLTKKKKKKGKNKLKHNAGHSQVPISKESSEEFSLASSSNETSACGSGCITVRNNDVTTFLQNNNKNVCDPELCTSSKGVTADGQLSCKESAPLFQETSTEEFSASTQNGTSNILTEWSIDGTFDTSRKLKSQTIIPTEAKYSIGFQTDSSLMLGNSCIYDPSNTKFDSVNKSRRLPDSHGIGCQTHLISTDVDFRSTVKAGGTANGHLHNSYLRAGTDGVNNIETGHNNDTTSVNSHDKNKHFSKVGKNRETQPGEKKYQVTRGKKVATNNFGLVTCSSGSTGSCSIGSVQSRSGKESNQSVWQKVRKNTLNGHIHESGDIEYRQLSSDLDSHNVLSAVNLNSEKTSGVQVSTKYSWENGNALLKNSKQRTNDYRNRRDSHDPLTRVRVKEGSIRSQHMRDGNSGWGLDGKTLDFTHRDVSKTGTDSDEKKTECCCSKTSVPILSEKKSCQKGTLDLSCQNKPSGRFPAGHSNISHKNPEIHNTDDNDKWKSSSALSTPCQHGDALQSNRDDFTSESSSLPRQVQLNWMLSSSTVSNSSDRGLLPTADAGDQMISAVISDVQCVDESSFNSSLQKEVNSNDARIRGPDENDINQCLNLQSDAQQKVPVEAKSEAMVMGCTLDTGAVDTQYMDFENNDHEGSNETHKLKESSNIGLKSTVKVKETDASNHVGQKNVANNENVFEVSCKCSCYISSVETSSDAEFEKMAKAISGSILTSYESQLALETISHVLGGPLAEFEKVLHSVSPEIKLLPHTDKCSSYSRKPRIGNSVCRCQITDIPLINIWHWFEEAGNYGLEVKAEEFRHTGRSSIDGFFRAYFVPYLSGMQLFGFSGSSQSCYKGAVSTARQETKEKINKVEDSYLSNFADLPILSTLLPKPFTGEIASASVCLCSSDTSNISSYAGNRSCGTFLEYYGHGETKVLFEFFESQLPQQRRPMFQKIRELINSDADSSSQLSGDPHILDSIKLQDLHPASWFSVAWYPIYRIPEGQLRSAFLTYHSLGHFVHRDTSSTHAGGVGSCIVAPVVGLQTYSAQAEGWFVPRKHFEPVMKENSSVNSYDVLKERLKTLEDTASILARGCAKKDGTSFTSKHSDYEFFLSRKRALYSRKFFWHFYWKL